MTRAKRGIKLDELITSRINKPEENQGWKSPLQQIREELNKDGNEKDYNKLKKLAIEIVIAHKQKSYVNLCRAIEKMDNYLIRKEYE